MHTPALETLTRQFVTPDHWGDATPIGSGHINDTYRVRFEKNNRVEVLLLQRLNHQVFTQPQLVMDNMEKIALYLSKGSYPLRVPAPMKTLKGQLLQQDEQGNYWRMMPFYENTYVPEGPSNAAIALEAAQAYGAFARALRYFPAHELAETIPGFHDTDRRWTLFLKTIEADPVGRVQMVQDEIKAMYSLKPLFDQISRMKKNGTLPLRVTHNDTKAGNILLDQSSHQAVAVIDWDTVMPGTILSDFGDMIRTFAPNEAEDASIEHLAIRPDLIQAIKTGFLSQTADFMTPTELEYLNAGGQWITGEQALRFLTDYIAGDTYYKVKYPEHNLVRARNQIALAQLLES
jgi:Ser/Thr protein kinase RdoA (MazF antagonist)